MRNKIVGDYYRRRQIRRWRIFSAFLIIAIIIGSTYTWHYYQSFQEQLKEAEKKLQEKKQVAEGYFIPVLQQSSEEKEEAIINAKLPVVLSQGAVTRHKRLKNYWPTIQTAAITNGLRPELLWAVLYVESGGRTDACSNGWMSACGISQFLPDTAKEWGLQVDLKIHAQIYAAQTRVRILTRELGRAQDEAEEQTILLKLKNARQKVNELLSQRPLLDERFAPEKSVGAAAKKIAADMKTYNNQEDFALAAYHAGNGNIKDIVRLVAAPVQGDDAGQWIQQAGLTWFKVYSYALRYSRTAANQELFSWLDWSRNYYFRVRAAENVLEMAMKDYEEFKKQAVYYYVTGRRIYISKEMRENGTYYQYKDIILAHKNGSLVEVPDEPEFFGIKLSWALGSLVNLAQRKYYRTLTPAALGTLLWIAHQVRKDVVEKNFSLELSSCIRTVAYQKLLSQRNPKAVRGFSWHNQGLAFDIRRTPLNKAQYWSFISVLERLQDEGSIVYLKEGTHLHITVTLQGATRYLPVFQQAQEFKKTIINHPTP